VRLKRIRSDPFQVRRRLRRPTPRAKLIEKMVD
jgi:hypothetical protein